ncbi:PIN domain-containing protein [Providencia stuartii]|uniref:PIN domain-containing protein n=1 Tax=Providencia stuartii TaxID=588 RepID=UPI001876F994|nr:MULTISPECIES: PIN domain-containing protein [Providencia]MDT2042020.1 PIN domain-containing protein [Providencia stuartii]
MKNSKYNALCIDTSIFIKNGLTLDKGLLRRLEQFKDSNIELVIPDIIIEELKKHLLKKKQEKHAGLSSAIKDFIRYYDSHNDRLVDFQDMVSELIPNESTDKSISEFIGRTGLEIINVDDCLDVKKLMKMYFSNQPPFEETGKKKSEFPDAIALLSLDAWAEEYNKKIIAVSIDQDWLKYSEHSEHIDVIDDLSSAISKLQSQIDPEILLTELANMLDSSSGQFYSLIKEKAEDYTNQIESQPDVNSDFEFDYDYLEISFNDITLSHSPSNPLFLKLIQFEDDMVVVQTRVNINATAYCDFTLFHRDSIDKDYFNIGTTSESTNFDFDTDILITFTGNFENVSNIIDVDIYDVEFLSSPSYISFGYIEPSYNYEPD